MDKTAYTSEQMLARLVGFNTISENSNLDLIHWVRDYLKSYGVDSVLVHDATKTKANLHAVVGPHDAAGVILSGHTDVVPVEGQAWDTDPFTLLSRNGLLYGRGACDMKGFLSVALAKLPQMLQKPLKAPVHFALSYDEEVGCIGAHGLSDEILSGAVAPRLCIVGEPTQMKLITGHKGIGDYAVTVHGKECHSSLAPYAVNAIEAAAELIVFVRKISRRMQEEGPFNTDYDPPFTTLQVGTIRGGTAMNIVPHRCDLELEIRALPETDVGAVYEEIRQYAFKNIEPRMKDIDPKSGFDFRTVAISPAFSIANDDPAVDLVRSLSGANSCEKVSFTTEAGIFQGKGIPTVVCGPGSIEQAHKPNEFIAQEQLARCETFIDRLLDHLCAA